MADRSARETTNFALQKIKDERARIDAEFALDKEREENRHDLAMLEEQNKANLAQANVELDKMVAADAARLKSKKDTTRRIMFGAVVVLVLGGIVAAGWFGIPVAIDAMGVKLTTEAPVSE